MLSKNFPRCFQERVTFSFFLCFSSYSTRALLFSLCSHLFYGTPAHHHPLNSDFIQEIGNKFCNIHKLCFGFTLISRAKLNERPSRNYCGFILNSFQWRSLTHQSDLLTSWVGWLSSFYFNFFY